MGRIEEIEDRLKSTTIGGNWKAVKAGSRVFIPDLSKLGAPYYSHAEDASILNDDDIEVLGCSEWMRCNWNDMVFMANAKSDIEFLLFEIKRITNKSTGTKKTVP